uniref:Uncharacterized protein n=1 Tax=Chlamydomonas leiostraca TaxID=1034604 RepID=A0A7S0R434_9CHLO
MELAASTNAQYDYEFCIGEERVLRNLTEACSTAGLAMGLQALVTAMSTVADFGVGEIPSGVGDAINAFNKGLTAALLFSAAASFDRALHTAGSNDVEHLVDGLGAKGLTGLFSSLAVLSWAITLATAIGLFLPVVEHDPVARAVGDGLSHRGAEWVVEGLQWARAIIRGI